jgi:acetate kinase
VLIFDPELPYLKWCKIMENKFNEYKYSFDSDCLDKIKKEACNLDGIKKIGYLLYNGGDEIKEPVIHLSEKNISNLKKSIKFFPERNDATFNIASYWMKKNPELDHILFCETAFFLRLPPESSTYAIPYKLTNQGIKRYGGYGLLHQWANEKIKKINELKQGKVISIYLGNNTNLTSMRKGAPVDTSIGFTPIEGIMSSKGCGDIDPTIVFDINSTGISFNEINKILGTESGFTALLGKNANYNDIIKINNDDEKANVKKIFIYSILKYIGAFISKLGGVDTIIFSNENFNESIVFIFEIINSLEFLGVRLKNKIDCNNEYFEITEAESKIKIFCLKYNKWKILNELSKTY